MRIVVQRVRRASVTVDGVVTGAISSGLLALVGFTHTDTSSQVEWMASKLLALRVFPDEAGVMNRSVVDVGGGLLLVSQFTLYGSLAKGTRPSYIAAAPPDIAVPLYNSFVQRVQECVVEQGASCHVATGIFGAMMDVELVNDGPVTILLER